MTGKIISRKSELTENYYYENLKKKIILRLPNSNSNQPTKRA